MNNKAISKLIDCAEALDRAGRYKQASAIREAVQLMQVKEFKECVDTICDNKLTAEDHVTLLLSLVLSVT